MWINVGVTTAEGMPILTKKGLKSYLADGDVRFYSTSSMAGPDVPPEGYTVHPREDRKLSVVGPDPYSNRKWYATVECDAEGRVKMS